MDWQREWGKDNCGIMELNYTIYHYDADRNAVIMTDMEGKELVIECDKAEANVIYEEPLDAACLSRLVREEPANYVSFAMKPEGLQGYVEALAEFN
ncbi:MAG: DUF6061 family protein [Clostridium sp.]|nr:DUF6061 family protein [Clostridium sp.]